MEELRLHPPIPEDDEGEDPGPKPKILPWERGGLGGEKDSDQSYEAFVAYRDLGLTRSYAKTAEAVGKSSQLMEKWARRDNWQQRALAWDRHSSRIINERVMLGTAAMRERAAGIGMNLQIIAAKRLLKMTEEELATLGVTQLAAMVRIGADVEARARAISQSDIDGAIRESAPTFNIGFVPDKPAEMISVRLPSGEAGYIPKESIEALLADYPEATVIA